MKMPKIKLNKNTLVTFGFALFAAVTAFMDEVEKSNQEKRIEDLERKVANFEKGEE